MTTQTTPFVLLIPLSDINLSDDLTFKYVHSSKLCTDTAKRHTHTAWWTWQSLKHFTNTHINISLVCVWLTVTVTSALTADWLGLRDALLKQQNKMQQFGSFLSVQMKEYFISLWNCGNILDWLASTDYLTNGKHWAQFIGVFTINNADVFIQLYMH